MKISTNQDVKWVYSNNLENTDRYILGKIGSNPLVCIGVNPSTATPESLDNTMKSVERVATNNGYDGFIMINLYPQRATNPNDMHIVLDQQCHTKNLAEISSILEKYNKMDIWASWGTLITKRKYLGTCLNDIISLSRNFNCNWISFGKKSIQGHPHHPLYLKKDVKSEPFNVDEYILKLLG